jgi:hypothetical protein
MDLRRIALTGRDPRLHLARDENEILPADASGQDRLNVGADLLGRALLRVLPRPRDRLASSPDLGARDLRLAGAAADSLLRLALGVDAGRDPMTEARIGDRLLERLVSG